MGPRKTMSRNQNETIYRELDHFVQTSVSQSKSTPQSVNRYDVKLSRSVWERIAGVVKRTLYWPH